MGFIETDFEVTINLAIENYGGKYEISDGEDVDYVADTLCEAYLYLAKTLMQKSYAYHELAMNQLQERINKL
jgi:hypothetical protein